MEIEFVNKSTREIVIRFSDDEVEDLIQGINCQMESQEISIKGGTEVSSMLRNVLEELDK